MKKKQFVIFLLISLVFIMGIDGCQIPDFQGTTTSDSYDADGLDMRFIKGVTPTSLSDVSEFQVGVSLRNSMLNDIYGELIIYDDLTDTFDGIPDRGDKQIVQLDSAEYIKGDIIPSPEEEFIFGYYAYNNLGAIIEPDVGIRAVLSYNVDYLAHTQLCLKRNARIKVPNRVPCDDYETITDFNVNPAPVVVSKIEKSVSYGERGVNVNLDIYLTKVYRDGTYNKGDVVSKDALYNPDEINKDIYFEVGFSKGQKFTCNPNGIISFDKNEKVISCRSTLNIQQDYTNDPFIIILNYGFRESITTGAIQIKKER